MSRPDFTLPEACERYEYVKFSLDSPLQEPAGDNRQTPRIHQFQINDRGGVYDFSKGYIDVSFRLERKTIGAFLNRGFVDADDTAIVNGIHSLIKRLTVKTDGKFLYDCDYVNFAVHIKKLLEMSKDYASTVGENELYYLDNTIGNDSVGYIERKALTVVANNIGANAAGVIVPVLNYRIPLNAYSIFAEMNFNNVLISGVQLRLLLEMEDDVKLIKGPSDAEADLGRIVLTKMDLMIPEVKFRPQYHARYIDSITSSTPIRWSYLNETVHPFGPTTNPIGVFKIPNTVNPKKVFFFFVNNNKLTLQSENQFHFDSFFPDTTYANYIGATNLCTLSKARLEVGSGQYYPEVNYTPNEELARLYGDVIRYSHADDDKSAGVQLSRKLYRDVFSMLYFDLEYKKAPLVSDTTDLTFTYTLSIGTNTPYFVYALVLAEHEAQYTKLNDSFVLLSEVKVSI